MVFQSRKKGVKSSLNFERSYLSPWAKIKKSEATFCRSTLLLSFCENRFCLSQLFKKLNSTERGAHFRHFCVSKVITTAHAHKSGVIVHFFPRAFKQKKIKALRPKMTKIASRGGSCLNRTPLSMKAFQQSWHNGNQWFGQFLSSWLNLTDRLHLGPQSMRHRFLNCLRCSGWHWWHWDNCHTRPPHRPGPCRVEGCWLQVDSCPTKQHSAKGAMLLRVFFSFFNINTTHQDNHLNDWCKKNCWATQLVFQRFNQLLLIQPTTNAKWSLHRRDNNSSNDTRRCW